MNCHASVEKIPCRRTDQQVVWLDAVEIDWLPLRGGWNGLRLERADLREQLLVSG